MEAWDSVAVVGGTALRRGYTTGTCAAAASAAAAEMLLSGRDIASARVTTPSGVALTLDVTDVTRGDGFVRCAVRKDGGDDPDVTHGALIYAEVTRREAFAVDGGEGVGRVTKPGLPVPPGEAAINPVPRRMIERALREASAKFGGTPLGAVISVPGGAAIAERTFNPRLGIVGGISILGTTGIVEPMSTGALVQTIQLELDAAFADGARRALVSPGNYGVDYARDALGLTAARAVKCSNFVGEAMDYARYRGFSDVLLVGHAGKLVKLAAGIFQTHSGVADGRREVLCTHAALCGAPVAALRGVMDAVSVDAAIPILREAGVADAAFRSIAAEMGANLRRRAGKFLRAEFVLFSSEYGELGRSDGAGELIELMKEAGE
jgi:cobalt-precorrin-5B (C1)-methyltransferase